MAQRQWRSDDTSVWADAFGDGSAGALTISADTADTARTGFSNTSLTGTATEMAATAGAVGNFAAGDLILIHQTRIASGAGVWELNKISSVGAGTNWTLAYPLMNTYAAISQVYRLIQYSSVTIDSTKTLTAGAWGGTTGGIVALIANESITVTGNISANGINGASTTGTPAGGAGIGFRGGNGRTGTNISATQGEGTIGAGGYAYTANGNGGGGGAITTSSTGSAGGGGGNGTAGGNGVNASQGGTSGGVGGAASGTESLVTMTLGGAGGGGANDSAGDTIGAGGGGGGIVLIISPTITISGTITSNGGNGGNSSEWSAGGAGAGGSILLKGKNLTLGTGLATATAGTRGAGYSGTQPVAGGTGGVGRIHADYSVSIDGTTTPTIDSTLDATIIESGGPRFYTFI